VRGLVSFGRAAMDWTTATVLIVLIVCVTVTHVVRDWMRRDGQSTSHGHVTDAIGFVHFRERDEE
jgi:hypothetical protein